MSQQTQPSNPQQHGSAAKTASDLSIKATELMARRADIWVRIEELKLENAKIKQSFSQLLQEAEVAGMDTAMLIGMMTTSAYW